MQVVVLHMPAQFCTFTVAQQRKVLGALLGSRGEVLRLGHTHLVRCDGQHQRSFHVTAMDAKALLMGIKCAQRFAQRQLVPVAAENRQAAVASQFPRHHVHQPHIAAMGVEDQEFFHAHPRHTFSQSTPLLDDRSWGKTQSAVIGQML